MALKFLKTGSAIQDELKKADEQKAIRDAQREIPFRYFLKTGEKGLITFLDGGLREDGTVKSVAWWEHNLKLNGKWGNHFSCTQGQDEPCPICQGGVQPTLMFAFTVLNHVPYSKDNKTYVNQRKLFACTSETYRYLESIATKRGGLAGCRFEVLRTGDKAARVGSHFDFEEKHKTLGEIAAKYGLKAEDVMPFDYDKAISYKTAEELRKLGFGTAPLGADDKPPMMNAPTTPNVQAPQGPSTPEDEAELAALSEEL